MRLIAGESGGNRVGETGRDRRAEALALEDAAPDEPAVLNCAEP
jgi:hypothetical protein